MTQQVRNALVLAAQLGENAALDRLLLLSATDAGRYARRHCQPSAIEDAVQEALLIVARKISALKAAAAFSGWLFTIVKRECDRMARAMLNHVNIEDAKVEDYFASRTDMELRLELAAALESLPAHYRRVILMRDFEEMTISEIAAALRGRRSGQEPAAPRAGTGAGIPNRGAAEGRARSGRSRMRFVAPR